jgi:uncharacterized protein YqjF (DUF2071 family)
MPDFLPNASFHRPRGWVMSMHWVDLLFMHWPVPAEALLPFIPAGLELDLFADEAWLSIVPFRMSRVRGRFMPSLPGLSAFPELNVRTYVKRKGTMPGVWFFSLDAANPVAVRAARTFFHLPYFDAEMSVTRKGKGFEYLSRRTHAGAPAAGFQAHYEPHGPIYRSSKGTLEDWLTARYCFYSADPEGGILRCDIHHKPWKLQRASAVTSVNTMSEQLGLALPKGDPILQFAAKTEVVAWLPERLGS